MEFDVSFGYEPQNEFKVWETGDNRRSKANFWWILVSGDGPAPLAMLACVKGVDSLARKNQTVFITAHKHTKYSARSGNTAEQDFVI